MSPEHETVYQAALQFARRALEPVAEAMDRDDALPRAVWDEAAALGYMGAGLPDHYGGSGGDLLTSALIARALAHASPAFALSYGAHLNLCAHAIWHNGTDAQRTRYLPPLARGTMIGALALTEPEAGSDATGIRTVARPDGGGYRLRGSKTFITNAPVASVWVVYAKTSPTAGRQSISAFIVERDWAGVSTGPPFPKLGMRGSPTGAVFFDDVFVPRGNLLGEENQGVRVMMRGLDRERAFYALSGVGIAEESLERALAHAQSRRQFGQRLVEFELVAAKLADMYVQTRAAELMTLDAIAQLEAGRRASRDAAAALLAAGQAARFAADEAIQILGGSGFLTGSVVERLYRDAKLFDIGAGTKEIRRLILARELAGTR